MVLVVEKEREVYDYDDYDSTDRQAITKTSGRSLGFEHSVKFLVDDCITIVRE